MTLKWITLWFKTEKNLNLLFSWISFIFFYFKNFISFPSSYHLNAIRLQFITHIYHHLMQDAAYQSFKETVQWFQWPVTCCSDSRLPCYSHSKTQDYENSWMKECRSITAKDYSESCQEKCYERARAFWLFL